MHHLLNVSEIGLGIETNRVSEKLQLGFCLNVPFPVYFYVLRTFYLVLECYCICQLVPFSVVCCDFHPPFIYLFILFPVDILTYSVVYDICCNN